MDRSARKPLPTRVEDTPALPPAYGDALDAGLDGARPRPRRRRRAPAIDGHVRLLLAWTEAINLTAIRDPAAVAVAHVVDSLSGVRVLRDRGVDRFSTSGRAAATRACRSPRPLPAARALLVEPIGKKAAFLETVVDGHRTRPGPVEAARRPGRGARRATRAIAVAGRRSPRGPSPAWPTWSSSRSRSSRRAASSSPGSAATSPPSSPPPSGPSTRSAAAGIDVRPVAVAGLEGHRARRRDARAAACRRPPIRAIPRARKRRPW